MGIFLQEDAWSSALREALPALIPLGLLGIWRWAMFAFRVIGYLLYKPRPPSPTDQYKTTDVTLIIPTIDTDREAMHEAMRSWVLNEPKEIIIVTVGEATQRELQDIADTSIASDITRVLRVEGKANKRIQLVMGVNAATTPLVCFTDDDAIWNSNFLKWLLVPFNDKKMGGAGSNQIMRPNDLTSPPTVYERIADMRLSSRMLEAAASTFYDGSVSCLSGRTALYHKRILNDQFPQEFTGEKWLNKYQLISGDDKFMTRWIVKHGWKMSMQISPECTLATTFKADGKFFMQILRWTRNTWRSDCKSLVIERDIWYRYPVQAILMCDRMISPFTLMTGPILFVLSLALIKNFEDWTEPITAFCIYFIWIMVSRTIRILPHIYRCPEDITYILYFIGYQYFFAVLKLYALFTLHITAWGTRAGVATNAAKPTGGIKTWFSKDARLAFKEQEDLERIHKQKEMELQIQQQKADIRVKMDKKSKLADKTYKVGNVALMRRIHMATWDNDEEDDHGGEGVQQQMPNSQMLYSNMLPSHYSQYGNQYPMSYTSGAPGPNGSHWSVANPSNMGGQYSAANSQGGSQMGSQM